MKADAWKHCHFAVNQGRKWKRKYFICVHLFAVLFENNLYVAVQSSLISITLWCFISLWHQNKKNNSRLTQTQIRNTTVLSHHYECHQVRRRAFTMNNIDISVWWWEVIISLDEDLLHDAFFTCLECSVIGWLTTHWQPSLLVPSLCSSLYL